MDFVAARPVCGILLLFLVGSIVTRLTLLLWFALSPAFSVHASESVDLFTKSTVEVFSPMVPFPLEVSLWSRQRA